MSDKSAIEWTDATWNPTVGCSLVSPGCTRCYAMGVAWRNERMGSTKYAGTAHVVNGHPVWTGKVKLMGASLDQPLRWKAPRRIFVNSMSDLFHEALTDAEIDQVFAVMALSPQHTFQVLTKRAQRMRDYIKRLGEDDCDDANDRITRAVNAVMLGEQRGWTWGECGSTSTSITTTSRRTGRRERDMIRRLPGGRCQCLVRYGADGERWADLSEEFSQRWRYGGTDFGWGLKEWPLPNVWLGVSVEDQARADERIPFLLDTPAAVRFLSCEPLLGPVDLDRAFYGGIGRFAIDWVICGGESGKGARPMHPDWARSLRDQCATAGVPFFFKQWGEWIGADEWLDRIECGPGRIYFEDAEWQPPRPLNYNDAEQLARICNFPLRLSEKQSDGRTLFRIGKASAGRTLDGRTHDEFPA